MAMSAQDYVRWFRDIRMADVPLVGGKNASLGEMYSAVTNEGVRVPNGFALTAESYRRALSDAGAWEKLHKLLDGLGKGDTDLLATRAAEAREIVYQATGVDWLKDAIVAAYETLEGELGN